MARTRRCTQAISYFSEPQCPLLQNETGELKGLKPPFELHKFTGAAGNMCRGTGHGVRQPGIPSLSHVGVGRSLGLFKAQCPPKPGRRECGKQAVTSWEKPKGRSSTSNYLHFFQNKSIWNKFNAKMYTSTYFSLTICHHMLCMLLGIKCSLFCMFLHGSLLHSIHLTLHIPWTLGPFLSKYAGCQRVGGCAAHTLEKQRFCFYLAFLSRLSFQMKAIPGL